MTAVVGVVSGGAGGAWELLGSVDRFLPRSSAKGYFEVRAVAGPLLVFATGGGTPEGKQPQDTSACNYPEEHATPL